MRKHWCAVFICIRVAYGWLH